MDFGLAFSFPFQDQDWVKKVLITAVISIIPILGQIALLGWSLEITRRVIQKHPTPLPDWSEFGTLLALGVKAFIVGVVFSIPLFIVSAPSYLVTLLVDPEEMQTLILAISLCAGCFSLLYAIIMALGLPAAFGQLAATNSIGQALNPAQLLALVRAAPGAYLATILGLIVAGIIAPLGTILCFVGVFVTYAFAAAVQGHLFGQAYLEASGQAPA